MINIFSILFALTCGIVPALIWLYFWLKEDAYHPEPLSLIMTTFLAGSLAVILVIPLEKIAGNIFPGIGLMTFLLWAILEEGFKFIAAYTGGIRRREDDEPLDPMIYMIVAALGFVAIENALFIISPLVGVDGLGNIIIRPLLSGDISLGLMTGNLRFIGAALLHIVSSSIIGSSLALNFYKSRTEKILWFIFAFIISVFVHTAFNLFIVDQNGLGMFLVFGAVWSGTAILILMFEKVKLIVSEEKRVAGKPVSTDHSSL